MDSQRSTDDDQQLIEQYLDGRLDARAREAFEQRLREDQFLQAQMELQSRIDAKLGELFPVPTPGESHMHTTAERLARRSAAEHPSAWRRLGWLAAAAMLAGVLFYFYPTGSDQRPAPYFTPTPLATVYHNTIQQGFEPYYECEDEQRFAEVFAKRQGQAMRLLTMPAGTRMLGLSYPGGLSRDTTAMLCEVDGEPVMVFVDLASADQPDAAEVPTQLAGTHVFRQQRDGLVFYEVSHFASPRVTEFLVAN